ncbi:dihydrolipoyl dehydrogenase [Arenicella xantha]|uniref:Dihydrolipoyl dehydrogenase n=1 Tax=Arenicella xantha TaxID=644221 RepID=A0A395JHL5_9GAMM|nr:dihydrolipoyl dehydrogenase [Arenicella xantha]RBP49325.1 dihydrolipoamide dehydrogenase [Arenicella xantha]
MSDKFDVIVVGAGPAGYVAAIRCAQLGMNTACVDDWKDADGKPSLGGTCLNVGCIPSKALLDSAEKVAQANHDFADHGISVGKVSVDVPKMIARKNDIVSNLTKGIAGLFKANKITSIHGRGRLLANKQVEVTNGSDKSTYSADNIIIAVGSLPIAIPVAEVDNDLILDNAGALDINDVPKKLGVIGAGVIGLELGSVWNRLGSEVTLFEAMDEFLAPVDKQISREAQRVFTKGQGLDIKLGAKVTATKVNKKSVKVTYSLKGEEHSETFDKLIVAVGRRANTSNIVDDAVGLKLDERGRVDVNDRCQTNIDGVYAIGDAVKGPMLAHKGSEEGVFVAESIAGQKPHLNHDTVPWVIYTHPEIAWVGITEEQAKKQKINYKTGFFPFAANGRSLAMNEKGGRVKMIADADTDRVLGVHILGPNASELISEAVLAMEYSASSEDIARTVHAHPTLSEALHEAALSVDGRALHKVN